MMINTIYTPEVIRHDARRGRWNRMRQEVEGMPKNKIASPVTVRFLGLYSAHHGTDSAHEKIMSVYDRQRDDRGYRAACTVGVHRGVST